MKILIATGGGGGHLYPALSLAEELKSRQANILFAVNRPSPPLKAKGYPFTRILAFPAPYGLSFKIFAFLMALPIGFLQSLFLLRNFKPDVVVGFGGYFSFPVVLAAVILKVPTLIHEQNVMPGRANRLLSKFVRRIALGFEEAENYFKGKPTVVTGNPIREHILNNNTGREKALKEFGLEADRFTILVMGGSQGASGLNVLFIYALLRIEDRMGLQVIHLTGERDYEIIKADYGALILKYKVFSFLDRMEVAYRVCDLVISRAGASTISELTALGLPAILIPYTGAGAHQLENAKYLASRGAAIMLEEENANPTRLKVALAELLKDRQRLKSMARASKALGQPEATRRLADVVAEIARP